MPRMRIDNREIEVRPGTTVLQAARALGLDVPALCWEEGFRPNTSCMVCVVKVVARADGRGNNAGRLLPSCALPAEDGLVVESETDEVHAARRAALELLLSDHAGECRAPCQFACPFDTDIPQMIREIAAGRPEQAAAVLRAAMPLAGAIVRVSSAACEGACRRCAVDEPAALGLLKRYALDQEPEGNLVRSATASGKHVAIVGAGAPGLSAAYFLLLQGHACTLFEACDVAGGRLRMIPPETLPPAILAHEVRRLAELGAAFHLDAPVGPRDLNDLRSRHDAVLVTVAGLVDVPPRRLANGAVVGWDERNQVFTAGEAARPGGDVVRAAVDGKAAAACLDQHLRGVPVTGPTKLTALGTGRPSRDEIIGLAATASAEGRVTPQRAAGLTDDEARSEALRCLHCDCHKLGVCKLQHYAAIYGADARRYRGPRRRPQTRLLHPEVVYEPGKCILCGLCIQVGEQAREPVGLAFVGRGFDTRVGVPFEESLAAALLIAARQCAEVCPTGALALRNPP